MLLWHQIFYAFKIQLFCVSFYTCSYLMHSDLIILLNNVINKSAVFFMTASAGFSNLRPSWTVILPQQNSAAEDLIAAYEEEIFIHAAVLEGVRIV